MGAPGERVQAGNEVEAANSLTAFGTKIALVSVGAFFTGLVVAYLLLLPVRFRWHPHWVPTMFWFSTGILLVSSGTLEWSRRALRVGRHTAYHRLLIATILLGVAFLIGQLLAWGELLRLGYRLYHNAYGSMYTVFPALHGAHVTVGLFALGWVLYQTSSPASGTPAEDRRQLGRTYAVSLYWHAMAGLWIVLFTLLLTWR